MSAEIENLLAALDGFRMSDQMDYAAYSQLHDLISVLDVPDWISVKDRLPPMYHMVLITGKNSAGGSFGVIKGSHDGDKGQWYRDDIGQYVDSRGDTVTHWMPLPEPPKEGNDPLYDFSGWTTEMIVAKIREIERKKEIAYKEYIDLVASFNSQLRALYNPLSNENLFNCDEPPEDET